MRAGSIPTRVGEPHFPSLTALICWVYPHSRGGTLKIAGCKLTVKGLSPLAWGNRARHERGGRRGGSIPTRVGEPRCSAEKRSPSWVYPHSRGGTKLQH